DEFSGASADSAKRYFRNVHQTTVLAFQQLMIEIDNNFKKHIQTFQTDVDTSEKTIVDKQYLDEVIEDIKTPFESLVENNEEVMRTIDDVADIVSLTNQILPQSSLVKKVLLN